jgi:hypothetical protein
VPVVSPFATPAIIGAIRCWFGKVATDVNALSRVTHNLRLRVAADRNAQPLMAQGPMPIERIPCVTKSRSKRTDPRTPFAFERGS